MACVQERAKPRHIVAALTEIRAGDGARTHDSHVGNEEACARDVEDNPSTDNDLRQHSSTANLRLVAGLYNLPEQGEKSDPNLAHLIDVWPRLPDPIKAAITALVTSAVSSLRE